MDHSHDPALRPKTTIHDLPDELLFHIGAKFTHFKRNSVLASLSLVSKKWCAVAQEWLLKEPRFNLTYIDQYLWELGHHEHLQAQIRSLEIWSNNEGRLPHNSRGGQTREYRPIRARHLNVEFMEQCKNVISYWATTYQYELQWHAALYFDCIPALFGLLICILPNLRKLKLGNCWLMDFPSFSNILSHDARSRLMQPPAWKQSFTNGAMSLLLIRLEVLEVPADMSRIFFMGISTVFDFRGFKDLKEIGMSMKPLWWFPGSRGVTALDPRELFPASLELLKISEATWATPVFIQHLCRAKTGGHFPLLRHLEIYSMTSLKLVEEEYVASAISISDPVSAVQPWCSAAEVELYMYFPLWSLKTWEIQGTHWHLREEHDVFASATQVGYKKDKGFFGVAEDMSKAFEGEWGKHGNSVEDFEL
jgi:hypothetical protein